MPSHEQLILVATATDRASPALRELNKSIQELNRSGTDLNKQSAALEHLNKAWTNLGTVARRSRDDQKHVRELSERYKELGEQGKRTAEFIGKDLTPAFATLGITALSVTGAITGTIEAAKGFAEASREIENFSKQTAFAPGMIRGLDAVAERFHVSGETIRKTLGQITTQMDMIRGRPDMGGERGLFNLAAQSPHLQAYANQLKALAQDPSLNTLQRNTKGWELTLEMLRDRLAHVGEVRTRNIAQQLGLDPNVINLVREPLKDLFEDMEKNVRLQGQLDPGKGEAYAKSLEFLTSAITGLRNAVGGATIEYMTAFNDQITDYLDKNNQQIGGEIAKSIKEIGDAMKEVGGQLHYLGDLERILNTINNFHPGTKVREMLPDWAKPDFSSTPLLPGVNAARGFFGAGPLGGEQPPGPKGPSPTDPNSVPIPGFAAGASMVTRGGLAIIHSGETITPAEASGAYAGGGDREAQRVVEQNTEAVGKLTDKLSRMLDEQMGKEGGSYAGGGGGGGGGVGVGAANAPESGAGMGLSPQGIRRGGGGGGRDSSSGPTVGTTPMDKFTPDLMPGGGGGLIPGPALPPGSTIGPKLEKGGIVTGPTVAHLGEAGHEAVLPLNDQTLKGIGEGVTGKTSIAALEHDQRAQAAIGRFSAAFPNVPDAKTQIYSLVQGESGMGRDMVQPRGQYAGYFQLGRDEAYGQMGMTKQQFAALPFDQQMDAYTAWAKRADPTGQNIKNLGLFNAASSMKWQNSSDDTTVYPAGSRAARANAPTWGRASGAGGAVTVGGIKSYYGRGDTETNRQIAAAGGTLSASSRPSQVTGPHISMAAVRPGNGVLDPEALNPKPTQLPSMLDAKGNRVPGSMLTDAMRLSKNPKEMATYIRAKGIDVNEATCAQFLSAQLVEHGGKASSQPALASSYHRMGEPGYKEGALNFAVRNTAFTGTGSHVTIPSQDPQTGQWMGTGANQGEGRGVVSTHPISIGTRGNTFELRHEDVAPEVGQPPMRIASVRQPGATVAGPTSLAGGGDTGLFDPGRMAGRTPENMKSTTIPDAAKNPAAAARSPSEFSRRFEGDQSQLAPASSSVKAILSPDRPLGSLGAKNEQTHKVEGSGHIKVDVAAPKGTNVRAASGGMFQTVRVNRQSSMPHVDEQH